MKRLIWLTAILWFPHSLSRIHSLGYDFPIYYNGGEGWYYSEWCRWIFHPLTFVPLDAAFTIWYGVLVLAWIGIVKRVGFVFGVLSFYPMLLCLELGQITPLLAYLCLTPLGSVIAGGVKPYLFGFVVLHIYSFSRRKHYDKTLYKAELYFSSSGVCGLEV